MKCPRLEVASATSGSDAAEFGDRASDVLVDKGAAEAKVWLDPMALATAVDLRSHEINSILRKVREQQSAFLKAWHGHFRY